MILVAGVALSAAAHAGPIGEVGVGYVAPIADERDDSQDKLYTEIVKGGLHVSMHVGWLFPVWTRPDVRVLVGPVASAAHTRYGDVKADDGLDGVTRWRFTGGARVAAERPGMSVALEGLVGTDRPSYDFSGLIENFCGDPTTSGLGWEATAIGQLRRGQVVAGASAGILHGDHVDDRPACTGGIAIDTVDYTSLDIALQITVGVSY
ncbi:MAG: hypothetical protein IPL61_33340 [Myxococcales bacterium]|nr:hypothetical protein [Myxococcales bacterium]